jgi:alpha-ribazole phosphatase/probable phosphoglycerate mutase
VTVEVVFETHQTTEDNEAGIATGWLPGRLSALGRAQAGELGERRGNDGLAVVFSSDLRRAVETVELAFAETAPSTGRPTLLDWRLRECDYGELNGTPRDRVLVDRAAHLTTPYPSGESWQQAVDRVGWFLDDLLARWDGCRVLVVGHVATRIGLEHHLRGVPVSEALAAEFVWQPGWEYALGERAGGVELERGDPGLRDLGP